MPIGKVKWDKISQNFKNHAFIISQELCDHLCRDLRDLVAELGTEVMTKDMGRKSLDRRLCAVLLGIRVITDSHVKRGDDGLPHPAVADLRHKFRVL